MATEFKKVVKQGWEEIYEIATKKLENIDNDIETKVAEYREKLAAESIDDKTRLQQIIEQDCVEILEVEVPDVVEETETQGEY